MQTYLDETIQDVRGEDRVAGNGGYEMIKTLQSAFTCVHPPKNGFRNAAEYMDFRRQNVGAS